MENIKKKVLIVEDEPAAQKAMVEKFEREGFEVSSSFDGEEGIKKADLIRPDVVLLDLIMPKMDGVTMLETLRCMGEWGKKVPVIILTNITSDDERQTRKLMELGPECYLVKADWKIGDVVKKVKETLGMA